MHKKVIYTCICLGLLGSSYALAGDQEAIIASAESAAPASVTAYATIKDADGTVLRKGTNSYICYPQQEIIGPMCNEAVWDELIGAMLSKGDFASDKFSVSLLRNCSG